MALAIACYATSVLFSSTSYFGNITVFAVLFHHAYLCLQEERPTKKTRIILAHSQISTLSFRTVWLECDLIHKGLMHFSAHLVGCDFGEIRKKNVVLSEVMRGSAETADSNDRSLRSGDLPIQINHGSNARVLVPLSLRCPLANSHIHSYAGWLSSRSSSDGLISRVRLRSRVRLNPSRFSSAF